jgi:hypothetical protein
MIARRRQHDVVMRVAPAVSRTRAYLSAKTSDSAPTTKIVPSQKSFLTLTRETPGHRGARVTGRQAVGALRHAQTTRATPTTTRGAAVSSASGPLGTSGTLDGLSSQGSPDVLSSRSSTGTGFRDRRITQMGCRELAGNCRHRRSTPLRGPTSPRAASRSSSGPAVRTSTVITGPPRADVRKATTRDAGVRTGAPTRDQAYCLYGTSRISGHSRPIRRFWGGQCLGLAPGGRV